MSGSKEKRNVFFVIKSEYISIKDNAHFVWTSFSQRIRISSAFETVRYLQIVFRVKYFVYYDRQLTCVVCLSIVVNEIPIQKHRLQQAIK